MAGSYDHCDDHRGDFTFDLIYDMADAAEACEQMFYMIKHMAQADPKRISEARNAAYMQVAMRKVEQRMAQRAAMEAGL